MPKILPAGSRSWWQLGAILAVLLTLPLVISQYNVYLLTLILVYALLATSLNLVLGYGGMLQLHHGVFFGLGAYTVALTVTKTSLPFWAGVAAAPLVAAFFAFLIGWFCVRLKGLYFGMLTLALGQLIWSVVYRWYELTGGDDGIHGIAVPEWLDSITAAYYAGLAVVAVCLFVLYRIVRSPFGIGLQACRDNSQRSESVGINLRRHRLIAFVIGGFFAGVAGILLVLAEGSVSPDVVYWEISAEIMIMCLAGGMYTFWGPAVGALAVVFLSNFIGAQTEYWLLILGAVLMAIVLFMPQGILGYLQEKWSSVSLRRAAGEKHVAG